MKYECVNLDDIPKTKKHEHDCKTQDDFMSKDKMLDFIKTQ